MGVGRLFSHVCMLRWLSLLGYGAEGCLGVFACLCSWNAAPGNVSYISPKNAFFGKSKKYFFRGKDLSAAEHFGVRKSVDVAMGMLPSASAACGGRQVLRRATPQI